MIQHESIGNFEGERIGYLKDARRRDDALLVSGTQNKVLVAVALGQIYPHVATHGSDLSIARR